MSLAIVTRSSVVHVGCAYEYILFDWDGTLLNTLDPWLDAYLETLGIFGVHCEKQAIAPVLNRWEHVFTLGLRERDTEEFVAALYKNANAHLRRAPFYNNAISLLQTLHDEGCKIAIVTSSISHAVNEVVTHHQLHDVCDVIVAFDDVQQPKPHSEPIFLALDRLGARTFGGSDGRNKDAAIMIGDSRNDIVAAQAAGIDSALLLHEDNALFYNIPELRELRPTYECATFDDVRTIVLSDASPVVR